MINNHNAKALKIRSQPANNAIADMVQSNCSVTITYRHTLFVLLYKDPVGIYLFKVNNRNTRTRSEICSKLTINTPERRHVPEPQAGLQLD